MSNPVNEDHNTRVKLALEDSIDHVFHFMKVEDLYNSAQVCRSWYREVIQTMRRRHLELNPGKSVLNLKVKDACVDLKDSDKNIALLFAIDNQDCSTDCKIYENMFCSEVFIIRVSDTWYYKSLLNTCSKPALKHHLPALFLQKSENTQIRISSCTELEAKRDREINSNVAAKMFNELIPQNNEDTKTILLLFTSSSSSDEVANDIITIAESRLEPNSFNIWGGSCNYISKDSKIDYASDMRTGCLSLAISGSNVETWSYVFDCFIDRSAVNEDLARFKNTVKLRNYNIGLVFGPSEIVDVEYIFGSGENSFYNTVYQKYSDFASIIESTFPEISLIGSFYGRYEHIFANDDFHRPHSNEIVRCIMAVSLLIITYD